MELPLLLLLAPSGTRTTHTDTQSTQAFPHFSPSTELVYVSTISVFISVTRNRCTQPLYKASLQPPVHRQERGGGDWTRAASFPRSWVGGLVGWWGGGEKGSRGKGGEERLWQVIAQHLSLPTSVGNPPSWRMRRLPDQCAVPLGLTSRSTW